MVGDIHPLGTIIENILAYNLIEIDDGIDIGLSKEIHQTN